MQARGLERTVTEGADTVTAAGARADIRETIMSAINVDRHRPGPVRIVRMNRPEKKNALTSGDV